MDKTMGANLIPFDNVCTWYSNKDTRPSYDAFAKEAHPLMTEIFKDIFQACPNIKAVVIHGEEPHKVIVKNGGFIPLELIVNKTHNVAHGCRLSNNAYRSCEWIIYTDVVVETVAILLDQDAIPLVTTEDRNEILLEPTWNSAEEKAARKRKRKDGKTAVEKAEEEAQRVAKTAKRDRKRAEKEAEEEAQCVAKTAERDRKRAEKADEEAQRVAKAAAKAAKRDAKWTAEVDASIESMINDSVSFAKIASKLGNGLSTNDISNRWNRHLNKLSSIIKPAVQPGFPSRITWTTEDDATIMRMRAEDISFAKIASELGNGRKTNDIKNRWYHHLKDNLQ
jgi:hypothetical protein